ncbi:enoyl-CoA hydratase/isomerase family protein, partial [bacterium]|nr:enoyl-CoA hydratase/isomerase family protein [bacterium]
MAYETIIVKQEGDIGIIKFNRPEALNAINPTVVAEVAKAVDLIEIEGKCKVLILTGEGEKAFVAGADIAVMAKQSPLEGGN